MLMSIMVCRACAALNAVLARSSSKVLVQFDGLQSLNPLPQALYKRLSLLAVRCIKSRSLDTVKRRWAAEDSRSSNK